MNRFVAAVTLLAVAALIGHGLFSMRDHTASANAPAAEVSVAPGVLYRAIPTGPMSGVDLVDIDLATARARIVIATDHLKRTREGIVGDAYTPNEWLERKSALAAVNGGYFGYTAGDDKEGVVGLLVRGGKVVQGAPPIAGSGGQFVAPGHYVRSAFGLTRSGEPSIAWVGTKVDAGREAPFSYPSPTKTAIGKPWRMRDAISCGPTLISGGHAAVTDYQERLVSSGNLPRTFVAYDSVVGRPTHFVMGVTSATSFKSLAGFLVDYFAHYHHTEAARAMCMDGGPSSQISYRGADGVVSPMQTGTAVPVAITIVSK